MKLRVRERSTGQPLRNPLVIDNHFQARQVLFSHRVAPSSDGVDGIPLKPIGIRALIS